MKLSRRTATFGLFAGALAMTGKAWATDYFTSDAVKAVLFPEADRFTDVSLNLEKATMKAISKASKTRVRLSRVPIYAAYKGDALQGYVVLDEVLGKHEFITYAIALTPGRAVKQIEIMRYVETYGDEVREPKWKQQFYGKTVQNATSLKVTEGIANIAGATLSCVHITDGVRRILTTFDLAMPSLNT